MVRGDGGRVSTGVGVPVMDRERVGESEREGVTVGEVERVGGREWVVERERVGLKESVREAVMVGDRVEVAEGHLEREVVTVTEEVDVQNEET